MSQSQDREARSVLCQLQMISAIPAKNLDSGHGTDDDPGGRRPPGDYGYRTFMDWYTECRTDKDRGLCIDAARAELNHLRKGQRLESDTESMDTTHKRMLEETAGWSLQDVARSHWRVSTSLLRRLRVADGREAENGRYIEPGDGQDLASRAREMKANGMSVRAIGMALGGVHSFQVQRLLRKAA